MLKSGTYILTVYMTFHFKTSCFSISDFTPDFWELHPTIICQKIVCLLDHQFPTNFENKKTRGGRTGASSIDDLIHSHKIALSFQKSFDTKLSSLFKCENQFGFDFYYLEKKIYHLIFQSFLKTNTLEFFSEINTFESIEY